MNTELESKLTPELDADIQTLTLDQAIGVIRGLVHGEWITANQARLAMRVQRSCSAPTPTYRTTPVRDMFDQLRLLIAEQLLYFALCLAPAKHPDSAAIIEAAGSVAHRRQAKVKW